MTRRNLFLSLLALPIAAFAPRPKRTQTIVFRIDARKVYEAAAPDIIDELHEHQLSRLDKLILTLEARQPYEIRRMIKSVESRP